ncbi:MAG: hypothetical protein AB1697_07745 [Pseudomonadota bacterium]
MDISFNLSKYAAVAAGPDPNTYADRAWGGAASAARFEPGQGGQPIGPSIQKKLESVSLHASYARALAGQDGNTGQMVDRRELDRQLEALGIKLGEAETKLVGIVKQYPPYAKDHPTRVDILNQITGLRKQIEALTIPPQKLSEKEQALANQIGFDAPDPLAASDQSVARSLEQVKQAKSAVAQLRAGMWVDIVEATSGEAERAAVAYARNGQEYLAQSAKSITLSQDVIAALG